MSMEIMLRYIVGIAIAYGIREFNKQVQNYEMFL